MEDDYDEVFAALKGRGLALPASNLSVSIVFEETPMWKRGYGKGSLGENSGVV
jgi:hypothetical protein